MNNNKSFYRVVGFVAVLIAVVHFLRLVLGWETVIAGWVVPMWFSIVAVVLFGWIAMKARQLLKQ